MIGIIADASIDVGNIIDGLTGAGSVAVAMWLWNRREVERADNEAKRADRAQERSERIGEEAIKALTEVNLFLSESSKRLENVDGRVSSEHVTTRKLLGEKIEKIEQMKSAENG